MEANPNPVTQALLISCFNCSNHEVESSFPSRQKSPETVLGSLELSSPFGASCSSQAGYFPLRTQMHLSLELLPASWARERCCQAASGIITVCSRAVSL